MDWLINTGLDETSLGVSWKISSQLLRQRRPGGQELEVGGHGDIYLLGLALFLARSCAYCSGLHCPHQ